MLKQKHISDIFMKDSVSQPICWSVTVPDGDAIAACNKRVDAQIREINRTILECKSQIQKYDNLYRDIDRKQTQAEQLQSNYSIASSLARDANLNINFEGCTNCIQGVIDTYAAMLGQCANQLTEWNDKLTQAESDLAAAQEAKVACGNITKTVSVCQ